MVPIKLGITFPLVFHTMGGLRHLIWDATTAGIDNDAAKTSSTAIFAASAATTIGIVATQL